MTSGRVSFIGAGPGSADLITVRGARRIAEAEVVVWASGSISPDCVREHAGDQAQLVDSSRVPDEAVVEIYRRAAAERLRVVRLLPGDPALWSGVQAHHDVCRRFGLDVEMVPGVSTVSAAASAAGRELTPDGAHSVVLARADGGKTPLPQGDDLRQFVAGGATIAMYLAGARAGELVEQLVAGGFTATTPVIVGHKPSWPDEQLLRTSLGELAATVKQHRLWSNTLFLIGESLAESGPRGRGTGRSTHSYRRPVGTTESARRSTGASSSETREPGRGAAGSSTTGNDVSFGPRASEGERGAEATAAWWAVRDWQETARGGARAGGRGGASRPRRSADEDGVGAASTDPLPMPRATTSDEPTEPVAGDEVAPRKDARARAAAGATIPAQPDAVHPEEGRSKPAVVGQKVSAQRTSTKSVSAKVDSAGRTKAKSSGKGAGAEPDPDPGNRRGAGRKSAQGRGRRS
ncbi:precorrin-4/cobalt-precorrin-4 C11-methyltransferase [Actinoalloteichus hoggarensis]|uniref:Precorrin-4 C(11)-methyltransferase n=1 Tax=Actinoalloteichus hoggarensis TaxID=1470176 RepID=A0A221W0S4_9PSEU|nr:cobalt-precorrin-4/precorrin-4 C(11)-methyltransferase [Actinoalloteichus hoggarensis]ASO19367.1 Precorrin-4 C(11)-methyltransferase [Actinoalloteichus hoggarensis]MBB5920605.1 precorrin-4/cobalt-precorrin-4 C11-methyltransferase [Actinoalloteichus hoggarensis]